MKRSPQLNLTSPAPREKSERRQSSTNRRRLVAAIFCGNKNDEWPPSSPLGASQGGATSCSSLLALGSRTTRHDPVYAEEAHETYNSNISKFWHLFSPRGPRSAKPSLSLHGGRPHKRFDRCRRCYIGPSSSGRPLLGSHARHGPHVL